MADFSLTIPDDQVSRVTNALCEKFDYQLEVPDPSDPTNVIPNPEAPLEFGRRMIVEFIQACVQSVEKDHAIAKAQQILANAHANDPPPPPIT